MTHLIGPFWLRLLCWFAAAVLMTVQMACVPPGVLTARFCELLGAWAGMLLFAAQIAFLDELHLLVAGKVFCGFSPHEPPVVKRCSRLAALPRLSVVLLICFCLGAVIVWSHWMTPPEYYRQPNVQIAAIASLIVLPVVIFTVCKALREPRAEKPLTSEGADHE